MYLQQLLSYARPYRRRLLVLGTLSIASSIVLLSIPWLAGQMLGGIVTGQSFASPRLVGLIILSLAAISILNFARASQSAKIGSQVLADLRCRIFDHVQRLPLEFHDSREKGDTLSLMTAEVARLSDFLTGTLVALPARLLVTVGAVALMFRIDQLLALIVPLLVPAIYLILKVVGRHQRTLAAALQQDEAQAVAIAEESLEMVPATKAFTREAAQGERYRLVVEEVTAKRVRMGLIQAALEPLISLIASLGAVAILVLAGQTLRMGEMTSAQLFSFIFYAALLARPVGALADVYGQMQMARGALKRLHAVLDEPAETVSPATAARRAAGEIRFENVYFAYSGRPNSLAGASFSVEAGETIALTGPNGAGKTAITNLLLRFYQPQSGTITIDGRDIATIPLTELRRNIGLVPQRTFLLNGTIRENIAFGADNPSAEAIDRAAQLAQAHDFVMALPRQMETIVGDGGVRLSGGQRQRIALARALIANCPILVLDEATSMFDEEGEAAFVRSCSAALSDRTVILITHREATLALANRILLLAYGEISQIDPVQACRPARQA